MEKSKTIRGMTPTPPPNNVNGEHNQDNQNSQLPIPPPPDGENSSSNEIIERAATISAQGFPAISNSVKRRISKTSAITRTVGFGDSIDNRDEELDKSKLTKELANLPITRSGDSAPDWMSKFVNLDQQNPDIKNKQPQEDQKTEDRQIISTTFKDRILQDSRVATPISVIYEENIKPKLREIKNTSGKKQYIEQCNEFLKANIEEKFEKYKAALKNIEETDPTSIFNNLPFFLQTMLEGRIFSKPTRRHILGQIIELMQIIENQNMDSGIKKYLKHEIADAFGHAMTMAMYNQSRTTKMSPSTKDLITLINKLPGNTKVGVKKALTFPHTNREDSDEIQDLNSQIDNIIQNPKDQSFKVAAEQFKSLIERAQSFNLVKQLMKIGNFYELQNAIDDLGNEWEIIVKTIKKPSLLHIFGAKASQYNKLGEIQISILEKIVKPQIIVLSEFLISETLLIPKNIKNDFVFQRL